MNREIGVRDKLHIIFQIYFFAVDKRSSRWHFVVASRRWVVCADGAQTSSTVGRHLLLYSSQIFFLIAHDQRKYKTRSWLIRQNFHHRREKHNENNCSNISTVLHWVSPALL